MSHNIVGDAYYMISEPCRIDGKMLTKNERSQLRSELQNAQVIRRKFTSREEAENVLILKELDTDIFSVVQMADVNIFAI